MTNVSVWFAIPSAATSSRPPSAPASAARADCASSSGSCSTRPGPGNAHETGTDAEPDLAQLAIERNAARARRALVEAEDDHTVAPSASTAR